MVLLNTCRLQFDLEMSAFHVGLVQSSTDAELAVVLVEEVDGGRGENPRRWRWKNVLLSKIEGILLKHHLVLMA